MEQFAHQEFTVTESIEVDGTRWDIGTAVLNTPSGLRFALAAPKDRSYGILLEAGLLTPDGKIEDFSLRRQTPDDWNGEQNYDKKKVPPAVLETLERVAQEEKCLGETPFRDNHSTEQQGFSHVIKINGKRWGIGIAEMPDKQGTYVRAWDMPTADQRLVEQFPTSFDENGITSCQYKTRQFRSGEEAREVTGADNIPPRLMEEMQRFANHYHYFDMLPEMKDKPMQETFEKSFAEQERLRQAAYTKNGGLAM